MPANPNTDNVDQARNINASPNYSAQLNVAKTIDSVSIDIEPHPVKIVIAEMKDCEEARIANNANPILPEQLTTGCWATLLQKCEEKIIASENEKLSLQVLLNFMRDTAWSYWGQNNFSLEIISSKDPLQQMAGQQFVGTLAMVLGFISIWSGYKLKGKPMPLKEAIAYTTAAAAAICPWDLGQAWGIDMGMNQLGMKADTAGYFASTHTGVIEGGTQFLVMKLGKLLISPAERQKFQANPKAVLMELGLNLTIGAVPGAAWQIVYNACLIAGLGPIPTALLVATAVASCNAGCSKLNARILDCFEQSGGASFEDDADYQRLDGLERGVVVNYLPQILKRGNIP